MRARRSRRDAERRADLFVRATRGDETDDLELSPREPGHARRDTARGRPCPELSQLLAGRIELALGAEMREDLMRATKLAHCAFAITGLGEDTRELTSQARGMRHVRNCL